MDCCGSGVKVKAGCCSGGAASGIWQRWCAANVSLRLFLSLGFSKAWIAVVSFDGRHESIAR